MQPKFTLRNLWYSCAKTVPFFIVFASLNLASFAQERTNIPPHKVIKTPEQRLAEEKALLQVSANDAGLPAPEKPLIAPQRNGTEAICTTWAGSVGPANTATSLRAFRDGVASTPCGNPGSCTPGLTGSFNYVQHSWTNPVNAVQCVTVNFTNPSGTNFSFVTAHSGSVVLTNLCTNWLGDPGSSASAGQTITFQINAPALATIIFNVTNVTAGQTANYSISVDAPLCTPPAPCSGTPSPGNTLASTSAACPTTPVNLSLQNGTPGSGVTYQWQTAPSASGPWTNAAGAPNAPTWSTTQTVATCYRCIVTCTNSGGSGTSTPVCVAQNPFLACYCASGATSNGDEDIFNVTYGTLNQTSNCATVAPGPGSINRRYSNYMNIGPPPVANGSVVIGTMPISIEIGTCGGNFGSAVGVWIDMNQNGNFEHPGERVFLSNTVNGPHIATGNATIPATALTGLTGMRVVNVETTNPAGITPCGTYTWGETEDYIINIQPCVPILSVTGPTTFTAQCSGTATLTNSAGSASFPTWRWEYRINASSPWQGFLNAGDLGGVVVSANSASLNGYQVRAVVSNPCTAVDFGPIATLSVVPVVALINPSTTTTICAGTIQPISLNNASTTTTATFNATGLPIAIPDANLTGISSTITTSGLPTTNYVVSDIRVRISVPAHTWIGDLVMTLQAPNGNRINLDFYLSATGNGIVGMNGTVIRQSGGAALSTAVNGTVGNYAADLAGPTATFFGAPSGTTGFLPNQTTWASLHSILNGNWTLRIADAFGGDTGSLTAWSIEIVYGTPAVGVWTSTPAAPNTMFTDPAATVPYVSGTPVNTIYVLPAVNTQYCVVYSTVSPACTSNPTCVNINVVNPLGTVVQPSNRSVCVGGTTSFTVTAPGGPFSYQWQETRNNGLTWSNVSNGGVYSGATTNTLTLTGVTRSAPIDMNNFRYRCVVTTSPCPGSFTSSEATLTVNALPTVTISATDLALLPNQTSTITGSSNPAPNATPNWAWTRNGAPIAGAFSSSVVADIDRLGVYQATVTDINGCRNSSNQLLIEAEAGDKLWLYPNPTSGQFQIRLYYPGVVSEKRRIQIFNSAGEEVMSRDIFLSNVSSPRYQRFDVDLGFQPAGVYLVKVIDLFSKKSVSGFVIKQTK
jgi:subtilisin-like proprotein convertase family protein